MRPCLPVVAIAAAILAQAGQAPEAPHAVFGLRADGNPKLGYFVYRRIIPLELEFWKNGQYRLHDRVRFTRTDSIAPWTRQRLYP